METSEQLPHGAVDAPDLVELVRSPGPFLSVYLHPALDIENAGQRSQTRWKTVRKDLSDEQVPEAVLERIDEIVIEAHLHGDGLAVIADAKTILHVEHGPALNE